MNQEDRETILERAKEALRAVSDMTADEAEQDEPDMDELLVAQDVINQVMRALVAIHRDTDDTAADHLTWVVDNAVVPYEATA